MSEVRVCEHCGHANDIAFLECEECGSDLSMVIPSNPSEKKPNEWFLVAPAGERFDVCDGMILGRLDSPCGALLNVCDYVSRHHAKLALTERGLEIVDTSANGTFVNGKRIERDVPCRLHEGDQVVLGDVTLEVHHAD